MEHNSLDFGLNLVIFKASEFPCLYPVHILLSKQRCMKQPLRFALEVFPYFPIVHQPDHGERSRQRRVSHPCPVTLDPAAEPGGPLLRSGAGHQDRADDAADQTGGCS